VRAQLGAQFVRAGGGPTAPPARDPQWPRHPGHTWFAPTAESAQYTAGRRLYVGGPAGHCFCSPCNPLAMAGPLRLPRATGATVGRLQRTSTFLATTTRTADDAQRAVDTFMAVHGEHLRAPRRSAYPPPYHPHRLAVAVPIADDRQLPFAPTALRFRAATGRNADGLPSHRTGPPPPLGVIDSAVNRPSSPPAALIGRNSRPPRRPGTRSVSCC